jgi:hypothetical protein
MARIEQQRRQIMKLQWAECSKTAFSGDFIPVLAKHTKHLSLVDILSVGVDRMQRSFDPMRKQVESWKGTRLPEESAKLVDLPGLCGGPVRCSQALGPPCP